MPGAMRSLCSEGRSEIARWTSSMIWVIIAGHRSRTEGWAKERASLLLYFGMGGSRSMIAYWGLISRCGMVSGSCISICDLVVRCCRVEDVFCCSSCSGQRFCRLESLSHDSFRTSYDGGIHRWDGNFFDDLGTCLTEREMIGTRLYFLIRPFTGQSAAGAEPSVY